MSKDLSALLQINNAVCSRLHHVSTDREDDGASVWGKISSSLNFETFVV